DPDYFAVKIQNDAGELIYDGMYADLNTTFSFEANTTLHVEVTAEWYDDPERSYCGDLTYRFTSLVTAPAEFYLGMDSVKPGRFVAVTALNILNPDKIQFNCEPAIGFTPTFYMEGQYAVALIPIRPDAAPGDYTMTFTYGGTTQDAHLRVESLDFGSSKISVSSTMLNLYRTEDTIAAFEDLVAELTAESESTRYFSGYFMEGVGGINGMPGSRLILRGFGREIILNGDTANTYRNNGVTNQSPAGTGVYAANAGKVVYAGVLDYTGNIVVIDHGFGLKTWYYNMGSYSAEVGAMVQRGDQIGTCGDTGFAPNGAGVQIAMSVGNQFVCPYDTWSDSKTAGKVLIWGIEEK
ncbi:MAG: M23 family metallopeptidase, partial [Clostridia bacterium]|nr:M23 family metallopeptidase [Clostridia bacterium]